jgi:hypothetical protein
MECYPDGLIVAHQRGWKHSGRLNEATAHVIEQLAQPIPLPQQWNLVAFKWKHSVSNNNEKCGSLVATRNK